MSRSLLTGDQPFGPGFGLSDTVTLPKLRFRRRWRARSGPGSGRERHRRRRWGLGRRKRSRGLVAALLGLLALLGAGFGLDRAVAGGGRRSTAADHRTQQSRSGKHPQATGATPTSPPAVKATLMPWQLPVALGREVVLAAPGTSLLVVGGSTGSGAPANGIFVLGTSDGRLRQLGDLQAGVQDASGAVLGGEDLVFGGSTLSAVDASVQALPTSYAAATASTARASSVPKAGSSGQRRATRAGTLPQPRAGSAEVTIGGTAYLLGGDNGEAADGDVLATADGRSFRTVATLAIPVRYPAAAVLGGKLYVFGGETKAPGAAEWAATGAVQQVDLRTGKSAVVGYLPVALVAASAVTLDGYVYLAGGQVSGRASATIWGLQPRMAPGKPLVLVSGHLDEPVSNAGTAVAGSTAWLVGGEVGGRPIASVQMFRPAAPTSPTAARPAHPGKG